MSETRVNLKHLLEDIRDSYPLSLEEVIVSELIANALDSGASRISFYTDAEQRTVAIIDNGKGMCRRELREYHNIAATAKVKGQGIGFAGIGAKLSLLIASEVLTETKGGRGGRCAASWKLVSETRAPWKFVPFSGKIKSGRGTAVTIKISHPDSPLLSGDFIKQTIINHYFPLFSRQFQEAIFKFIYKKGVEFFVNDEAVLISEQASFPFQHSFWIRVGRKTKRPAGFGFLARHEGHQPFQYFGLAVSTYGKIIKWGWEWLGITPAQAANIYGVVEIPALSQILTVNKMDFLRNVGSLKKYYRYRKAVQEAILPILEKLGEKPQIQEERIKLRPLVRTIERNLKRIVVEFPELLPLLGIKNVQGKGFKLAEKESFVGVMEEIETSPPEGIKGIEEKTEEKSAGEKQKSGNLSRQKTEGGKGPALVIGFEELKDREILARMMENRVLINTSHPAYRKASESGFGEYHAVFCVAWVFSQFLEEGRSSHQFISQFLSFWGKDEKKIQRLFGA